VVTCTVCGKNPCECKGDDLDKATLEAFVTQARESNAALKTTITAMEANLAIIKALALVGGPNPILDDLIASTEAQIDALSSLFQAVEAQLVIIELLLELLGD